jgi:hypothetical protein
MLRGLGNFKKKVLSLPPTEEIQALNQLLI